MISDDSPQLEMFSAAWYDEYYRRAAVSPVHARFCEQVYGRDLCQHGMMDMSELEFLIALLRMRARVLDVGCGAGGISEYIHERSLCTILGVDYSQEAIRLARHRTQTKNAALQFEQVDLTRQPIPGNGYDYIIAIDSLYYLGDFVPTLQRLCACLAPNGKLILSAFQNREEGESQDILTPEGSFLGRALVQLNLCFAAYDFTTNLRNHWIKNYQVAEALKQDFAAEGNLFLYEARRQENLWFKKQVERDAMSRFLYVVRQNNPA